MEGSSHRSETPHLGWAVISIGFAFKIPKLKPVPSAYSKAGSNLAQFWLVMEWGVGTPHMGGGNCPLQRAPPLGITLSMDTLRAQSLSYLPTEITIRAIELELKISMI